MSRRWVGVGEMKSSIGGRDGGNAAPALVCGRVMSGWFKRALKARVQRRGGILFRGSIVGSLEQRSLS